ncbi:MAG: hypothetical protein GWN18_16330 [Thermoplasmata archaeon]|nr:hypothetical protein [Thermoplasmata archaeon]NIS13640.1 hypothetical protein [Thermoplasmata archaeon]NIS21512.1 hypothetical protein [Thermoplasmata archaeon]NIT79078.1 hypothetical protein [Thermoplasmata archaeon]NIU50558.1 hypothetical protein [Thermoplasmata archaeon]
MFEWMASKVATSVTVLVIAASFTGLFSMQAEYYRTLELEDLADAFTDLVTEVDLLSCEAVVVLNWTDAKESHGLPREFQGEPYMIELTRERPFLTHQGVRVSGRYFPSELVLIDDEGERVDLLEVASTTGLVIRSQTTWCDWGLDTALSVEPLR